MSRISGNGKQKGYFIEIEKNYPNGVTWCKFRNVRDVVGSSGYGSTYGNEFHYFNIEISEFYLPEKDIIINNSIYRQATNQTLVNIIGDEYFKFY